MALTEEQKDMYSKIARGYMTRMAECAMYNWDAEFIAEEVKSVLRQFTSEVRSLEIDFNDLTAEDCKFLGCDKNNYIPMHLLNAIPAGTHSLSVLEEKVVFGEDHVDNDNRCGFTAYRLIATDGPDVEKFAEAKSKSENNISKE